MTESDQQALDRIESDRKKRERELLLLMLLLLDEATLHVNSAVRIGSDPRTALQAVLMGSDRIRQPGLAPTLAESMGEAYLAGIARAYRSAGLGKPQVTGEDIARAAALYQPQAMTAVQALYERMTRKVLDGLQRAEGKGARAQIRAVRDSLTEGGFTRSNPSGLEMVAEAAVLTAHNSGLFTGYRAPDVMPKLIGFRHLSVVDERTTDICREREGLTLKASDPYWLQNWPLLHWRCRSAVRAIFQGEHFGESNWRPITPPMEGFGLAPLSVWLGRAA